MKSEKIFKLKGKRKLTMLTAYDYPTARILNECEIDMILVGDSLGMVVLGYCDTKSVTLDDMIRHGAAVVRGALNSLVILDMPINTYNDPKSALKNAIGLISETGCKAVKIEGRPDIVKVLVEHGIPTCGHTGLKPQLAEKFGVIGRDEHVAKEVMDEACALSEAGAFCVVLECVPSELARLITKKIAAPTIGIGAGAYCDGQVLVISDMIGLNEKFKPKFVRRYGKAGDMIRSAVKGFKEDVANGRFPDIHETF